MYFFLVLLTSLQVCKGHFNLGLRVSWAWCQNSGQVSKSLWSPGQGGWGSLVHALLMVGLRTQKGQAKTCKHILNFHKHQNQSHMAKSKSNGWGRCLTHFHALQGHLTEGGSEELRKTFSSTAANMDRMLWINVNFTGFLEKEQKSDYIGFCKHDNHFELCSNFKENRGIISRELIWSDWYFLNHQGLLWKTGRS